MRRTIWFAVYEWTGNGQDKSSGIYYMSTTKTNYEVIHNSYLLNIISLILFIINTYLFIFLCLYFKIRYIHDIVVV